MPMVRPITSSQTMAPTISSSVAGRRDAISVADLGLLQVGAAEIALQQAAEIAQILHAEAAGRGRAAWRMFATVCGVALRPAIWRAGSAGSMIEQDEGDRRVTPSRMSSDWHEPAQRGSRPSAPPLLGRIEDVAQRVADEIEGQRQQQDRGAGDEHQPRRRGK